MRIELVSDHLLQPPELIWIANWIALGRANLKDIFDSFTQCGDFSGNDLNAF